MLGLRYDKLPKVVWWFFTTFKRERKGDEVLSQVTIVLGILGVIVPRVLSKIVE